MTSERVDQLDPPAEVFYRRLLSKVDDHGLYDARPSILRASLFPLRLDRVREADCSRWIAACVKAGLIVLYEAEGKQFLKVLDTRWQVRSEPKYPVPCGTGENNCSQVLATEYLDVVGVVVDKNPLPDKSGRKQRKFDYPEDFEAVWAVYPARVGDNPKRDAFHAWNARRKEGVPPDVMRAGVERYAKFLQTTGKVGTEYVKQASTFFGPNRAFENAWQPGQMKVAPAASEVTCEFADNAGQKCGMPNAKPSSRYGNRPICAHHERKIVEESGRVVPASAQAAINKILKRAHA